MRNKFVALSTLVPMAFAISFSGADPVTECTSKGTKIASKDSKATARYGSFT